MSTGSGDSENSNSNLVNEQDENLVDEPQRLAQKCVRLEAQVSALKEVSCLRKNLLDLREKEVKDLIAKLKLFEVAIEEEKVTRQEISCRVETAEEKCLELTEKLQINMDNLNVMKTNYEEKISKLAQELEKSDEDFRKRTDELTDSELRNIHLQSRVDETNNLIGDNETIIKKISEEMQVLSQRNRVLSERNRDFTYQMNLLNTLFNETAGTPIDFDRIRAIGDIFRESQNNQNGDDALDTPSTSSSSTSVPAVEEDMNNQNLSPSRRASIDFATLLDHIDSDKFTEDIPGEESCYKKVATIHGPQLVLSVSQTFIKLKDLILEKKSLQREIESLKHLNLKLESKVDRQERRLYSVTTELTKTWNLVAKLKIQHDKLHTSEAVLKYELHEKRKMLERLKYELSRSRQQWVKVRQKNECAELECKKMRAEFASRRKQASSPASQESGAFSESSNDDVENDEEAQTSRRLSHHDVDSEHQDCVNVDVGEEEEEIEVDVDPLEEFVSDLVDEIEAVNAENESIVDVSTGTGTTSNDDIADTNRASRLRRLEDASRVLYSRLMATTVQSSALASRLAQLHTQYGTHDETPLETEYDEITMETESSADVAYASALHTTTDDTEIDSQFEDIATPGIANVGNTMEGSVEMLYDDGEVLEELIPNLGADFQEDSPRVPSPLLDRPRHVSMTRLTMTNAAEVLSVEIEMTNVASSTEHVAVSDVVDHYQSGLLLSATTTPVYGGSQAEEATSVNEEYGRAQVEVEDLGQEQEILTSNDGGCSSTSSSPDPNNLSRLIIQQVPKRLEILKLQNSSMKDKEQLLKTRVSSLEIENDKMSQQLEAEIQSKQDALATLKEMNDLTQTMKREKETLTVFMKNYLTEKADLDSTDTKVSKTKKCRHCEKKFSILMRRKHICSTCKQAYCKECTTSTSVQNKNMKKGRICGSCNERRLHLESIAQSFL